MCWRYVFASIKFGPPLLTRAALARPPEKRLPVGVGIGEALMSEMPRPCELISGDCCTPASLRSGVSINSLHICLNPVVHYFANGNGGRMTRPTTLPQRPLRFIFYGCGVSAEPTDGCERYSISREEGVAGNCEHRACVDVWSSTAAQAPWASVRGCRGVCCGLEQLVDGDAGQ
jgi:hypothetical protein